MNKKIVVTGIIIILGLGLFGGGFFVGQKSIVCETCPPSDVNFSLFWEAWNLLKEKYGKQEDLKTQDMIYGAISGMVDSLKDPHTVFMPPEDSKKFLEDVGGRFEGVGMEIGVRKGQLQIIAPLEGTPAKKAGLRSGDKIIKINETMSADVSLDKAVSIIRGPKGSEVVLIIMRDGWDEAKEFKIKRDIIEVPSLRWKLISSATGKEDENGDIVYISLYQFSEKIDSDFTKEAFKILNSPAEKIILDLRNNPGGYLQRAQDIAGWFLKEGQIVTTEDFYGKKPQIIYKAKGNSEFENYPMVILINQGSASAAEILAAALRDNRGVKIIGEKSFGKGSVQELEGMNDGSNLKITVGGWLTPNGVQINELGLEPDIKVEMTENDYQEEKDPQLEKAIEIIKEIR
ncbi:MAG: hypothetical protein A2W55_00135 [Candidatus Nealsonbacteria bacterium RIFCSPHIGHO2_02_38_10]|nr:MAG: Carboxyl-terminal protease [Parcubacteria group bacterium GW2011_GWA2_38_27]OGZ20755.1 MAG: hypothetical protein A2W55_00135 [Candidatus Nealsonbacteria bacterium RIFCSPHIGHO2_02_38_10]OGZ20938.1 MAG: hypothetical protein A3C48_03150 [Candidatus Nealsonbacteria bacterium RIFCSPHIGHO2_02_FULL_38_75]OGZ23763.1 MAG: hypothetical protein A2981_02200 [Candidatus Nealsonbacteria bacterium RIFCSPLOWO2_01_FULL_38_120]OGZ25308.1 MAG: hypothetical protein A3I85_02945 [Candidatus Nealsonbacteria b